MSKTFYSKTMSMNVHSMTSLSKYVYNYCINKVYSRIKDIATDCGVKMPPRRGFVFLDSINSNIHHALWCIHLSNNTYWENNWDSTNGIICEKKAKGETAIDFQKRIYKDTSYGINVYRLCFVEEKRKYRFIGVFQISKVDFDNQTVLFKKIPCPQLIIKVIKRRIITINIEEEVVIEY